MDAIHMHIGREQKTARLIVTTGNAPGPATIRYRLEEQSVIHLSVFNILGQQVCTLARGIQPAGIHSVTWDGRDQGGQEVASGVYIYLLKAGPNSQGNMIIRNKLSRRQPRS